MQHNASGATSHLKAHAGELLHFWNLSAKRQVESNRLAEDALRIAAEGKNE
jgi:hypothetical protein